MFDTIRIDLIEEERDLWVFFNNIEELEDLFGIEFSCGDGLFSSDLECDSSEEGFPLFVKYDGVIDWNLFRLNETPDEVCATEDYYIRFKYDDDQYAPEPYSECKVLKFRHRHN